MTSIALPQPAAQLRPWARRLVRLGHAAKGVIYLLIGAFALQLALGDGGRITNSDGVLRYLTGLPLGTPLLIMIGVGLLALAGWSLAAAFTERARARSAASAAASSGLDVAKAVIYGSIGWHALQIVLGAGRSQSRGAEHYARQVLQFPLGEWALVAIGVGVAIYGVREIWFAWRGRLDDEMDEGQLRSDGLGWVIDVGRAGTAARGIVFAVIGVALARAGANEQASAAGGTAEALTTLLSQPLGTWVLAATAAGLVCYGVWQLLLLRYARI
jgi:hypothetical protein